MCRGLQQIIQRSTELCLSSRCISGNYSYEWYSSYFKLQSSDLSSSIYDKRSRAARLLREISQSESHDTEDDFLISDRKLHPKFNNIVKKFKLYFIQSNLQ